MQLSKHFLTTLLASICLTSGPTFLAHAADKYRHMPGAVEILFTILLATAFAVAVVAILIVLPGHYGFKSNPILTERICYSLGAVAIVWAANRQRQPATMAAVLALAAGALTYYVFSRLEPNG